MILRAFLAPRTADILSMDNNGFAGLRAVGAH